jgi:hypothetical protein
MCSFGGPETLGALADAASILGGTLRPTTSPRHLRHLVTSLSIAKLRDFDGNS